MTNDLPIPRQDERADGASVLEWGAADESTGGSRLRRAVSGLGRDHRVPLLLAGLGAAAAVASLLGEWVTMTIPTGPDPTGPLEVTNGVAEIGGLGTGYLTGLLGLGCTVALALRGTRAAQVNARVAGLALAAGMIALLAATTSSLGDAARRGLMFYSGEETFRTEHGRGLFMAFAAVLLFAAALVRIAPAGAEVTPSGAPADPDDAATDPTARRRSRRRAAQEDPDEGRPPADITVSPTVPFARESPPD
ncbi:MULTISPECIES: hypothetical protein [unclassified Micromonospora]|uniref:hypothetical protein n=1 Tax=unclassified Micromonospora TaxID=2617518 RepID=UPI0010348A38|nr:MULTISPECIES: hypothetical protein [unclassified Micromonospora]QKW16860.1 hypothetical protein HUT12_31760 [Verrucosispora sp. NA02020]TBL39775.1 hypothetical protein EYA84_07885 [Verrucosispora sp. SN26_14.1]